MQGYTNRAGKVGGMLAAALLLSCGPAEPARARVILIGEDYPTLAAAVAAVPSLRARLRAGESLELVLPPGPTRLTKQVVVGAEQGGSADAPLILRGADDGSSYLTGAVPVRARPARLADAPGIALPSGTLAIDLAGLPDFPVIDRRSAQVTTPKSSLQLFQGRHWLTPSRWPATGYATGTATGTNAAGPTVALSDDLTRRLRAEPALWAAGYWGATWEYDRVPIASVSASGVRLEPLKAGQPVRPSVRFRIENAVSALSPGHIAVLPDRQVALVLPAPGAPAFEATVSSSLLRIDRSAHVTITGIGFERSGGDAVRIDRSNDVVIADCVVRDIGGNGIMVTGGENVLIRNTIVTRTGERGVTLGGGSRADLTPAGHAFVDGLVTDFGRLSPTYRPGVELWGVGNRVSGSVIAGGEHAGIIVSGNDHAVTDNEVRDVLRETDDAGAIYMGADWTFRGNTVSGNHIHGLGSDTAAHQRVGVYLDDQIAGETISKNVIVGGDYSVLIGGGRDNAVTGNLFAFPQVAGVHVDSRGLDKQKRGEAGFLRKMTDVPVTSKQWRQRYPALAGLTRADYGRPQGNSLRANLLVKRPGTQTSTLGGPAAARREVAVVENRNSAVAVAAGGESAAAVRLAGAEALSRVVRVRVPELLRKLNGSAR